MSGRRVYIPKGWRRTQPRDALIRRLQATNCSNGMMKMESIRLLAERFALSEKRIQSIIYNRDAGSEYRSGEIGSH